MTAGIRIACEELFGLGHRRIALISAPLQFNFARQRHDSFQASMDKAGLRVDPRHMVDNTLDRRSGYQAMQQLLAAAPRPTAVIVDNHLSGVGAVRALLDAGVEIGKEMSVIVWGSVEDSLVGSNVATIDQPDSDQAGAKMIEMLMAVVGGADPAGLQVLRQPTLVSGATVGPCLRRA